MDEYPLPILLDYIKNLEDLYYKYLLIDRLIELTGKGFLCYKIERKKAFPTYFANSTCGYDISSVVADSNPRKISIKAFQDQNQVHTKKHDSNLEEIVEIFQRKIHPVFSYSINGVYKEIIEEDDKANLKIKSLVANSPVNLSLEGFEKILNQIFYGKYEEIRKQEQHDLLMLKENLKVGEYLISLEDKMNNVNISNGTKNYIYEMLEYTKRKQKKLVDCTLFNDIDFLQ